MKRIFQLLFWVLPLVTLCSCEDNANEENNAEFTNNWQYRNEQFFAERVQEAKQAIAEAKQAHGDQWESHCDWRLYRSYAKLAGGLLTDTICVKIVERGANTSVTPLYTDSVKVNYIGYLMPTESYPKGRIFDHSGLYESEDYVFSPSYSTPIGFSVSNLIEGFTTALLYMHIGDRCRIYIPNELGYQNRATEKIPAFSTLVYDTQLKAIYRAGSSPKALQLEK